MGAQTSMTILDDAYQHFYTAIDSIIVDLCQWIYDQLVLLLKKFWEGIRSLYKRFQNIKAKAKSSREKDKVSGLLKEGLDDSCESLKEKFSSCTDLSAETRRACLIEVDNFKQQVAASA